MVVSLPAPVAINVEFVSLAFLTHARPHRIIDNHSSTLLA
jgi:hypothetical protein